MGFDRVEAENLGPTLADRVPSLSLSIGAQAGQVRDVTIQVKDANGNDLAQRTAIKTWVSTTEYFDPVAGDGFAPGDGGITRVIRTHSANALLTILTPAAGTALMSVTDNGGDTLYVMAELDGKVYSSGEIVITAP